MSYAGTKQKHPLYILIREEQPNGTDGGTFSAGDWRVRTLNTVVEDETGEVSLNSDQFTLPAGKYVFNAYAPAYFVSRHQLRLENVSDSTSILGTVGQSPNSPGSSAAAVAASQIAKVSGSYA